MRKRNIVLLTLLLSLVTVSLALGSAPQYLGPIYDGPELDYQPSIIRMQPGGQLLVIFERFGAAPYGNFYASLSGDNGETWSAPVEVLDSPLYERHPSLLQLAHDSFLLFYLVDETGQGNYRIHRAISLDGLNWMGRGRVELGWASSGEINPNVIREADGTLTMTYHRLYGPSYIAQSTDDGATWDTLRTQVSVANAQLPRLARRERDGLYIITYQVGGSNLDLFAKVSHDPYDWSGPQIPVSVDINTHDSQPIVLEDGAFFVTYAKTYAGYFDLAYRISCDGVNWFPEVRVTNDPAHYDTQPHPLLQGAPGHIILSWSHQDGGTPYQDHDVWINSNLVVPPDVRPGLCASTKQVSPALFEPALNLPLSYTLSLANYGLSTTAWLTDPLPDHTVYRSGSLWASSGDYGYDPVGQAITWTGSISWGAEVTITFQVSTTALLADGDALVNTALLTDGQGLVYPLTAVAWADGLPPTSSVLDPLDGQWISATTYLISGVASDTVSGIAAVEVGIDGGIWQPALGGEGWTFQWDGLTDGVHNIRSRATDGMGREEQPGPGITVTVDTTPPTLDGYSPADGALDVPLSATVVLTFSEPIVSTTLAYVVEPDPGGWSVSWNVDGTVAALAHLDFAFGRPYTFSLNQARDRASNPVEPVGWTFVTVESPCDPVEIVTVTAVTSGCQVTFGADLTGTAPYSYSWDLGAFGHSTASNPLFDLGTAGVYPYTLTVLNCASAYTDVHAGQVTVTCAPPCEPAEIVTVTVAISGCQVTFGAELTGTAPYSYSWNLSAFGHSTASNPLFDLGMAGVYPYTLTVLNCASDYTDVHAGQVTVTCAPPCEPAEILTWTTAISGCQVDFAAEAIGTGPLDWLWDFGDGITSTLAAPTHTYSADGGYTVTLQVTNCAGIDERIFALETSCARTWEVYLPLVLKPIRTCLGMRIK